MAIIPLRAYNREIEGMIDSGQLDEAVAHCRHILATFPKHIASYRLLGKAHLEQQRISDATDIFQRVLSAIPDDFIANVGMSIIREDENNLDASIWHMELAYEAQPSNVAIQDELRRLYGRRDGMQPPKVRLTRGALARMYAKGGLFDQSIAELRAAVSEDPNRPDLQLLLAEMFFQTSQRVEAVETCANILKKLPFCLAANQILAVSLPESEQSDVRKNYRQNSISMDPYFAFASLEAVSSELVPENAVNIERFEWKAGIQVSETPAQPAWATSLGISIEKPTEEKLPEWLKGTEAPAPAKPGDKAQSTVSPFIWDTQEVEKIITNAPKPEGEIPDWMKDAGWKPASGEPTQEPEETITEPPAIDAAQPEEPEKADIPDWLRGIAPEGILAEELPGSQTNETEISSPWLETQRPGPTDSIIEWLEDKKPESPVTPPKSELSPLDMTEEEIPDWLKDLDVPSPTSPQEELSSEKSETFPSETPAFIEQPEITEKVATNDIPLVGSFEPIENIEPVPDLAETQPASVVPESEELPAAFAEELPDWIKELAGEATEAVPSSIKSEELEAELPAIPEVEPSVEIPEITGEVPITEWLDKTIEQPLEETPGSITEELAEDKGLNVEGLPIAEGPGISTEEPIGSTPDIFAEMPATEVPPLAEELPIIGEPLAAEGDLTIEVPAAQGESDAFAWLEGLADQTGAEVQEPVMPIEAQETTPPEWVNLEAEPNLEETLPELEAEAAVAPALPAEEIPEWIKGLGEIPEIEEVADEHVEVTSPEPEALPVEELPAWMLELEQPEEQKEAPLTTEKALEWKEEELPDWIKELTETAPSKEATTPIEPPVTEVLPVAPAEQISDWTSEEVSHSEVSEVEPLEAQPQEPAWVSEFEEHVHPQTIVPIEAEEESAVIEELVGKAVEIPATTPLEQQELPVVESPEGEFAALENARNAINQGFPAQAAEAYTNLVNRNLHLEEVIKDLQDALYRFPVDVNLWVTLGDAYYRTNELQLALNSYTKAEDLVR